MSYISIIIPAYNEQERIADTINAIKNSVDNPEIIVIDDGSKDNTYDVAKSCNVKVIRNNRNLGKGNSIKKGLELATSDNIIVFLDADLGKSAKEVIKLIQPVKNNEVDMTIGRFKKIKSKAGFGLVRALSRYGVKKLTGREIHAALSGQRALKKEIINRVKIEDGFGIDVALTIDAIRYGFRIKEIDVDMHHRVTHRSIKDFIHRANQFKDIAKVLLKRIYFLWKYNKKCYHQLFH